MPLSFDDLILVRRKVASTTASIPNISPSSARFSLTLVSVALAILFLLSLVVYYTVRIFFSTTVSSNLDMEKERETMLRYWHTADFVIGQHPHALAYSLRRATRTEVEVISGHVHIPLFNSSFPAHSQRKRGWTLPLPQMMYSSQADHTSITSETATTFDYDYGSKSNATGTDMLQVPPSSTQQPAVTGPVEKTTTIQSMLCSRSPPSSPAPPRSPSPRRKPVPSFLIQIATTTPSANASSSPISSPVLSESGMAKADSNANTSPSSSSSPLSSIPTYPGKRSSTFFPLGELQAIKVVSKETKRRSTIDSGSTGATMLTRSRPAAKGGEVGRGRSKGRRRGRSQDSENPPLTLTLPGPPPMAPPATTMTTTTRKLHSPILHPQSDQSRNMSLSLKVSRLVNLCAPRPIVANMDPTLHPRARAYLHAPPRPDLDA